MSETMTVTMTTEEGTESFAVPRIAFNSLDSFKARFLDVLQELQKVREITTESVAGIKLEMHKAGKSDVEIEVALRLAKEELWSDAKREKENAIGQLRLELGV